MARGDVLLVLPPSDSSRAEWPSPSRGLTNRPGRRADAMVAPVTSNLAALRFAFSVRVEPSPENGLTMPSVVMVFQMRAIDES